MDPVCRSNTGYCPPTPEELDAQRRREEERAKADAQREAERSARNLACIRNPELKGCRWNPEFTVSEDANGPGAIPENDDPGVREAMHRYDAGFAKMRAYAKTGQVVSEEVLRMMPGPAQIYYLKVDAEEARAGNWTPILLQAAIFLPPGTKLILAEVKEGLWAARVVRIEATIAAEEKIVAREAFAAERLATRGANALETLARRATRNPDSSKVILGKFLEDGKSYTKVAAHYKATYFKVDDWNEVTRGLSSDEIWALNETFLRRQIEAGKEIILSHDPTKATGFFKREVNYLQELGYQFVQDGWVWRAVR